MISRFKRKVGCCLRQLKNYLKAYIDYGRLCYDSHKNRYNTTQWSYVVFDHNMGGGATQFLNDRLDNVFEFRQQTIVIRYLNYIKGYKIEFIKDRSLYGYIVPSYKKINKLLRKFAYKKIFVNELFEYENVYRWLELLKTLKAEKSCELVYLLHDYYCICPMASLALNSEKYCELKYNCDQCLKNSENYDWDLYGNIYDWREQWKNFLEQCTQIVAFSEDTQRRVQSIYGDISIDIIPHKIYKELRKVEIKKKGQQVLNVGILGSLSRIKGVYIVRQMIEYAQLRKLPIKFILVGEIYGDAITESAKFSKTGKYKREELPKIIEKNEIDIVFVASVIPETFSYTTHEAIMMNIPVICFDLGAQAEYVKQYKKGLIIPKIDYQVAVESLLAYWEEIKNG